MWNSKTAPWNSEHIYPPPLFWDVGEWPQLVRGYKQGSFFSTYIIYAAYSHQCATLQILYSQSL